MIVTLNGSETIINKTHGEVQPFAGMVELSRLQGMARNL